MDEKKRYVIVVNKYWECDPVCWVLTNMYLNDTCGIAVPWPKMITYPSYGPVPGQPSTPRLIYASENSQLEVWCVSDLLSKFPDTPNFQSSSERKMAVLGDIFTYNPSMPVDLVAAVGTASSGPFCPLHQNLDQDNINGSVVVGTKVFMHDGHPESDPNLYSRWRCDYFDQLMNSSLSETRIMKTLAADDPITALLSPPTNPATYGPHIYGDDSYVAIGDINVTDYSEYATKDREAGKSFVTHCPDNRNGVSLETTHGLIYATARDHFQGDPPFLFVSGVVDRFTMFNVDVSPKVYAQNVTGAHNAGVAVAMLVADLMTS